VVPKACLANPKGFVNSSHWMCGYISVMAALTFTYFLIQVIMFLKNKRRNSSIGDLFLSNDKISN
jgi:predicted membrane chloride channel (bestrophin family)